MFAANFTAFGNSTACVFTPGFDHNITNVPSSVKSFWTFLAVVHGVTFPPTFVINLLIIWTVLENEIERTKSYNLLFAALAVTDLLVGLVVEPTSVLFFTSLARGSQLFCNLFSIWIAVIVLCGCLTLCTLTALSVNIYLATEHPQFYFSTVTRNRVLVATALTWVTVPVILFVSKLKANELRSFQTIPDIVIVGGSTAVILFCTIKTQMTVYSRRKKCAPVIAAPVQPIAGQQATVQQIPGEPVPVQPILSICHPDPCQSVSAQPSPSQPASFQPIQGHPAPVQLIPGHPAPLQPIPGHPDTPQPIPDQPAPVQPIPGHLAPDQPIPGQPDTVQPPAVESPNVQPIPDHQAAPDQQNQARAFHREKLKEQRIKEYRRGLTISIPILTSVLFYCPLIIYSVIALFKKESITDNFNYIAFREISVTLINLQSLMNPIIAVVRMNFIRKGVKNKLLCCFCIIRDTVF